MGRHCVGCSSGRDIHRHGHGAGGAHGEAVTAHGYVRLLVQHRHGHVVENWVCRDAIPGRAGEGWRIERIVPWVATSTQQLSTGHIWQTESGVSRWMDDQNAATLHSIQGVELS